jgi:P-type Ca2+ transporter type 2C
MCRKGKQLEPEPDAKVKNWHAVSAEEALRELESDSELGLTLHEARHRLGRFGPNRLREEKKTPPFRRFLSQFNDFMIWVLLAAVLISGLWLKEFLDAAVILVIVLLNALLGFIQETRAESALARLKELSAPLVKVLRDGHESEGPAEGLVPGDLVTLEAGDLIAADCRLVSSVNLMVNESSLTGESVAVSKDAGLTLAADTALGDRFNMVFAGTHVEYGRGSAVVAATGQRTELGQIATMLEEAKPSPTPLQVELRDVGKRIVYLCLITVFVVLVVGLIRGYRFADMLLFAVSLAVAAIPEGLPAVVTITLAQGTQAMARQNAIIRNLPAVETLGCANYICSDKTGTLTLNRMTVTDVLFGDGHHYLLEDVLSADGRESEIFQMMAEGAALCNDARRAAEGVSLGDPTEVALMEAAEASGLEKATLEELHPRVAEIPFDSDRKMMTTVHRDNGSGGFIVFAKGAVEVLLDHCESLQLPGGVGALERAGRELISRETVGLGSQALRTIGVAFKRIDSVPEHEQLASIESGLTFLGALAMKDPPRAEVLPALELCRGAQIDVAMITGDHRATAESVARELGILVPGTRLVEGHDVERMTADELSEQVEDIHVYARVAPHHKVKIVEALQKRGHVVAMTGDGVNDAPALKYADIGVAMGITGTDVSKEAADMVLADDNFATIVAAVRQGRIIFANLKKFIYFLLSCNISEVLVVFVAMIVGFPLPLIPVQILWINLVTDGLPALALGVDPPEKDVMEHPPRVLGENILAPRKQVWLAWQGLLITAGALAAFILSNYVLGYDWNALVTSVRIENLAMARTVLFTTMVLAQVFHSYNMRSETRSFFSSAPWENRYLLGSFAISIGLQMFVLYAPFMQKAFKTQGPTASAWLLILLCAFIPILIIDRIKVLSARRARRG